MSSVLASSMATPTIWKPCGPYSFCSSTNHGISVLQGPQYVAQKLSRTALPRRSESLRFLPSSAGSSKSGAKLPMSCPLAGPLARLSRAIRMPANNMAATMAAMKNRIRGFLFTGTSAAKAACVAGSNGMAEAMPLQSYPGTNLIRVSLESKAIQEREIAGDEREAAHHQQDAQPDQQGSAHYLHGVHVEFEAVVEL